RVASLGVVSHCCAVCVRPFYVALISNMMALNGRESPIFDLQENQEGPPKMIPNGDVEGSGRYKIHRLRISRSATCTVLNVVSPSCIWVKQINHITDRLQITDLSSLTHLSAATVDSYVMAPLQEGVYSRARILQLAAVEGDNKCGERKEYARVLFIDEGITTWVSTECLAKMDVNLSYHPWQAIATALFKVRPGNGEIWSENSTSILRGILSRYEFVRIKVIQNSADSYYNFHTFLKVDMSGLESIEDPLGESISNALALRSRDVAFDRTMFDAISQRVYECEGQSTLSELSIPKERWKLSFVIASDGKEIELADRCVEWDESGLGPQVKIVDVDLLDEGGYFKRGDFLVNVEGSHTVSPYEFYARPLLVKELEGRNTNKGVLKNAAGEYAEEDDAMIAANDELQKRADELNSFYGHPKNRKSINAKRVRECLDQGKRVYAIAEVQGDMAVFTGLWQRVEIIGVKVATNQDDYYCRIRFLDSGGMDIRALSTVLEIHPIHCDWPPLCLQMCIHGIKPAPESTQWSPEALRFFHRELREDVPIALNVHGRLNKIKDETRLSYSYIAHELPNVIFVSLLQVRDGVSEPLDARLVREGYAVWSPDSPMPLPDERNYGD
uniref:Tudor domain-containing protein n=4 Tax=Parascaris univalens TaxID=6257 RepID=A0A915BVP9_PARUN